MSLVSTVQAHIVAPGASHGLSRWNFAVPHPGNPTSAECANACYNVGQIYTAIHSYMPTDCTVTIDRTVIVSTVETGLLLTTVDTGSASIVITGTSGAVYTSGTGSRLELNTGVRNRGRLVRGAVLLVPLTSAAFTAGGVVDGGFTGVLDAAVATAFGAMNAAGEAPVVWTKPRPATIHYPAETGSLAVVTSGTGSDNPCLLQRRKA